MKLKIGALILATGALLASVATASAASSYTIIGAGETPAAYAAAHPECNGLVRIINTRYGGWSSTGSFPPSVPVLTVLLNGETYWVRCG